MKILKYVTSLWLTNSTDEKREVVDQGFFWISKASAYQTTIFFFLKAIFEILIYKLKVNMQ